MLIRALGMSCWVGNGRLPSIHWAAAVRSRGPQLEESVCVSSWGEVWLISTSSRMGASMPAIRCRRLAGGDGLRPSRYVRPPEGRSIMNRAQCESWMCAGMMMVEAERRAFLCLEM